MLSELMEMQVQAYEMNMAVKFFSRFLKGRRMVPKKTEWESRTAVEDLFAASENIYSSWMALKLAIEKGVFVNCDERLAERFASGDMKDACLIEMESMKQKIEAYAELIYSMGDEIQGYSRRMSELTDQDIRNDWLL
jgi:hypothetical protein